jgi:Fe-S cluster assembly ATP-binding protein
MALLSIHNLHVQVGQTPILHGVNLDIKAGEIHAIMGPNGSGKSTLAGSLMGHPDYTITEGTAEFCSKNLFDLSVTQRALEGLFLSFQYPKEIPGVSLLAMLRTAYNAVHQARDPEFKPVSLYLFKKKLAEYCTQMGLPKSFMERGLNEGFSGGEKKKAEMIQWALLQPQLAILDETDSGLDIDALKTVCETVAAFKKPEQSILMITHYERMLRYLKPDHIHIMMEGRILKSGGPELAQILEEKGYESLREELLEKTRQEAGQKAPPSTRSSLKILS